MRLRFEYLYTVIDVFEKSFLQPVELPAWKAAGLHVSVLRDDLIHPFVSGNKWRKLKYNILDLQNSGRKAVVTFGGAFSNHLIATAAASRIFGFDCIGIIRGEEVNNEYTGFLRECGMVLHFISRADYRKKSDEKYINSLLDGLHFKNLSRDDFFVIPEGGSNEAAITGSAEIMNDIPDDTDYIAVACGTGATLAGIARALKPHQQAIGIQVLKADGYIHQQVMGYNGRIINTVIKDNYHFGGYAKTPQELIDFSKNFSVQTNIPIEPIYTGKLIYAIDDMIKNNFFRPDSKLVLVHTGGVYNFGV